METPKKTVNTLFITGLVLSAISYLFLFLPSAMSGRRSDDPLDSGIFLINYGLTIFYVVIILIYTIKEHKWRFYKMDFRLFVPFLILFTMSGFSLNYALKLFSEFTTWLKWYVVLMHIALLGLCFIDSVSPKIKSVLFFISGASFILAFYFTILMLNLIPIGIIGCFFFGLTLHVFIPMLWSFTYLVQFLKKQTAVSHSAAFVTGCVIPLLITGVFLFKWNGTKQLIHEANASIITRPKNTLPQWVLLSQVLPHDFFTDRVLKGELCYDTWQWNDFGFGRRSGNSFGETKKHDPLVLMGLAFGKDFDISEEDRIKILQSEFDARHHAQRKLWSGGNLVTSDVLTDIRVFPDYRLAYIEKIISVKNTGRYRWEQEEAAYTFHLPEGSVATSLSLWIDGKEEQSRLSTKAKADSAYVAVVGVERRDPALLHWQEGNTITVTVFPCTTAEPRKFKIGITIPLEKRDQNLVLKNVYFEGPEIDDALETTVIEFVTSNTFNTPQLPDGYELVGDKKYQFTGNYRSYWEMKMNATPLSQDAFVFNNKSFRVEPLSKRTETFDPLFIYLDINKSWDKKEFNEVWNSVKEKDVFVYYDKRIKLTDSNREEMFSLLKKQNFSLFPFHKIEEPEATLVVSKSAAFSPSLEDLKGSGFLSGLKSNLANNAPSHVFSLTNELSPYLKTLKEYRVFNLDFGDTKKLEKLLADKQFPRQQPDNNTVELDVAEMQIVSDTTFGLVPTSIAPDHVMRLFAYNQVLKKIGKDYFSPKGYVNDDLVAIANEAYVVTPVSSLVVLESIKDYDRFGIGENLNSLKNATIHQSGAVPEPHEWVLLILIFLMLMWMFLRSARNTAV